MSETPVDDVTMELATVLDEYSAVDCYKFKKNASIEQAGRKKALVYNTILKSNFPGAPRTDAKYKVPDSIDMDYIDMLSGKDVYTTDKQEAKVPISMKSFEKLCYFSDLMESQEQARMTKSEDSISSEDGEVANILLNEETSELENLELGEIADDNDETRCSPCCFDLSKSSKDSSENHQVYEKSENTDAEGEMSAVLLKLSNDSLLSDVSEESNITSDDSPLLKQDVSEEHTRKDEKNALITPKIDDLSIQKSNEAGETSSGKRKKSLLQRIFSKKDKVVKKN